MPPFLSVVLVVSATSVIQSLFGVGVLLFGTPWLLLLGLEFIPVLQYLLPVSLAISSLQVLRDAESVERSTLRRLVTLALPAIAVTLWATSRYRPPLDLLVAAIVAAVAIQERVGWIGRGISALLRYERGYMILMGAVHGASNLGGGLLTAWVYGRGRHGPAARGTVAMGYVLFVSVQLLTLFLGPSAWKPAWQETVLLTLTGMAAFVLTDRLVFANVRATQYRRGLELLLLMTSLLLVARSLS